MEIYPTAKESNLITIIVGDHVLGRQVGVGVGGCGRLDYEEIWPTQPSKAEAKLELGYAELGNKREKQEKNKLLKFFLVCVVGTTGYRGPSLSSIFPFG